jgi:hypothetical protein
VGLFGNDLISSLARPTQLALTLFGTLLNLILFFEKKGEYLLVLERKNNRNNANLPQLHMLDVRFVLSNNTIAQACPGHIKRPILNNDSK